VAELRDIDLDDCDVERLLQAATSLREELIYRLALRRLCKRLRRDLRFGQRVAELLNDVPRYVVREVLAEAAVLERELRR
jgi:hypothetical protein